MIAFMHSLKTDVLQPINNNTSASLQSVFESKPDHIHLEHLDSSALLDLVKFKEEILRKAPPEATRVMLISGYLGLTESASNALDASFYFDALDLLLHGLLAFIPTVSRWTADPQCLLQKKTICDFIASTVYKLSKVDEAIFDNVLCEMKQIQIDGDDASNSESLGVVIERVSSLYHRIQSGSEWNRINLQIPSEPAVSAAVMSFWRICVRNVIDIQSDVLGAENNVNSKEIKSKAMEIVYELLSIPRFHERESMQRIKELLELTLRPKSSQKFIRFLHKIEHIASLDIVLFYDQKSVEYLHQYFMVMDKAALRENKGAFGDSMEYILPSEQF